MKISALSAVSEFLQSAEAGSVLLAQAGNNVLLNAGIFVLLAAGAVYAVCRSSQRN
ncbi:hypothetical protein [Planctellipticum variicoloris]|uniref:hypothetical protein n=1 Tax=Planctellipticum variicoloris TaxID=3064265 RepID=UPI0030133F97|nr:hypothetical protein SH412_001164 [Planctomycetaceae bacterium SH412]